MSVSTFYPNARANLTFSGKRDVMSNQTLKFGRDQRPVPHAWFLTDFRDQTSNARVYQRFEAVRENALAHNPKQHTDAQSKLLKDEFQWNTDKLPATGAAGQPKLFDISDIPARNVDYASQALFELAQEPNHDVFVHVTDPGVGSGKKAHERSILVTENHGVHIGPNNGTLGLFTQFLKQQNEPFKLLEIDLNKTNRLEAIRKHDGKAGVDTGSTFHGRDVFAVAAGAIAAGIKPESLATEASQEKPIEPTVSEFGALTPLPAVAGNSTTVRANRDNTAGNLVLNVALSQQEFDDLLKQQPRFTLKAKGKTEGEEGKSVNLPLKRTFGEVEQGKPLMYLGSKRSPDLSKRFLEVAVNCGDVAERLQLGNPEQSIQLTLERDHPVSPKALSLGG